MTVRTGRPDDETALRGLQALLREPSPPLLSHGLRTDGVLVAEAEDGAAVGYLLTVGGDGVHVAELVVHPDRRREGRATRLLRRLLAGADGRVTLLVAADNDAARGLYASLGFRLAGPDARRQSFYDDGTDAILLARDPSSPAGAEE
ncbi:GNAT family N-acetyltransferase [Halobaculum gomorrense]|uniref:Ribosomal-protein-alanine N-acetyltransferase n=1 Tax=Halobaculum gomorrense TaxID=43928 RepID=A0A1M5MW96_9EURY|nr:GNAT family N-acetyltransferase [Halobaculum gomorrense]SHG81392.1 ribosomal-protein-alanine N-acetyltransferase [Halobaculum gomorrense]